MRKRKESLIMIVIISVLFLGIGYAYLTTNLSINGTADVDSNTWNVYWDNVQVTSGSVTGNQVITQPTIDTNKTTVSFHIRLKEPGEFYEFTVDAKNDGTIDAMIETITKTINNSTTIPDYLDYSVTYYDYFPIKENQLLNTNKTETYRVRIEYKNDIESNDLPSTNQSLSISFGTNYIQAKDNTKSSRLYTMGICEDGCTGFHIGEPLPTTGRDLYYNYSDIFEPARFSNGYGSYLTLIEKDNKLSEVYVGYMNKNKTVYLRGLGSTYNESTSTYNNDSIYYDENVNILLNTFGSENCSNFSDYLGTGFSCFIDTPISKVTVYKNGYVIGSGYGYGCVIQSNGVIYCAD